MKMKRNIAVFSLIVCFALMTGCATTDLSKDATWKQKAAAICSDLESAILLGQIGLTALQQSNWAYDYSKAQLILTGASNVLSVTCSVVKTDADLLAVRNGVLTALSEAQKQQGEAKLW
jgi:hypothetical protein